MVSGESVVKKYAQQIVLAVTTKVGRVSVVFRDSMAMTVNQNVDNVLTYYATEMMEDVVHVNRDIMVVSVGTGVLKTVKISLFLVIKTVVLVWEIALVVFFSLSVMILCADGCKISCDRNNGTCDSCKERFNGDRCDISCPLNCKDRICARFTGMCTCNQTTCRVECQLGTEGSVCATGMFISV